MIEAQNLPEKDEVYLKKDMFGWRTVEPYKIDGKINWFNLILGGKRGLMSLAIIMIIVGFLYLGVNELIGNYKMIADAPCEFCESCPEQTRSIMEGMKLELPEINYTEVLKLGDNG